MGLAVSGTFPLVGLDLLVGLGQHGVLLLLPGLPGLGLLLLRLAALGLAALRLVHSLGSGLPGPLYLGGQG